MKKVYYISKEVSDYLYTDTKHQLSIINIGVLLFQRNIGRYGGNMECIFRIAQDGIINVIPHMSKRIIKTDNIAVFKQFIMHRYHGLHAISIPDAETRKQILALSPGCFVLAYTLPDGNVEALAMHKFNDALSTMIPKENLYSLHVRFLDKEEREIGKICLE
jgi:hypothetical protein